MNASSDRRRRRTSETASHPSHTVAKDEVHANPFLAFRAVVYGYGVERLADEIGRKRGTLYNKADADAESHHQPTLRDVIEVTRATGDTRVLDSLDRLFDRTSFLMKPPAVCSDEALLELLCKVGDESGQMHAAVLRALKDGRVTRAEVLAVRAEAYDLVGEVLCFLQRLEGLVDE
jgi:hypothetical protein